MPRTLVLDPFDDLGHHFVIGGRPPGNQLGPVGSVVESHLRKGAAQNRVCRGGACRGQFIDDDFGGPFARRILDEHLEGRLNGGVILRRRPDGEPPGLGIQRGCRAGHGCLQDGADRGRVGLAHLVGF